MGNLSSYTREQLLAEKERRQNMPQKASLNNYSRDELLAEKQRRQQGGKSLENERTFSQNAMRQLGRVTKNVLGSATDVLDFVASPVRTGLNAVGLKIPTLGSQVEKGFENIYQPETDRERVQDEMMRAVVTLPFGGAIGSYLSTLKYAPSAIKYASNFLKSANAITPANVGATAAASGVTQHAINQNPEDPWGAMGKGFIAGVGASVVPGALSLLTPKGRANASSKVASNIGSKLGVNPSKIETFKEAGITPSLADVGDYSPLKVATTGAEKIPYIGKPLKDLKNTQYDQILEGLGQVNGFSPTRTTSGELAIKGAKSYKNKKDNEFNKMFTKVKEDIKSLPDNNISLDNVHNFFKEKLQDLSIPDDVALFEQSPAGKLYKRLDQAAEKNKGTLPYGYMKRMLDKIRDQITTHGLIGDVSQGELKGLSKAIANDIDQNLSPRFEKLGGNALNNWKNARSLYHEYASGDILNLNEMFNKNKKGAVDAFKDLVLNQKNAGTKTKIVLEGLEPKQREELMTGIINEMGRNQDGTFSPVKWATQFKGLEKDSRNLLLSPLNKPNQKKVEAIADAVGNMKSTLAEANTSGSAYHGILAGLTLKGLSASGQLLTGNPWPAAKLAGGLLLGRVATSQLMANPKFINWIDRGMKAKNMNQFDNILSNPPKIGKYTNALHKEAQMFQHDLKSAKDKK